MSDFRPQRWLDWKNYDDSADPTCPAFGFVELFGYEFIGGNLVLKGRSSRQFSQHYYDNQGAQWFHAFNGQISVAVGSIGKCTFDLPTYAALEHNSHPAFNSFVTLGLYLDDAANIVQLGSPWRLEPGSPSSLYPGNGGGYNVYCTHPAIPDVAYVGGLRTFVRAANSA